MEKYVREAIAEAILGFPKTLLVNFKYLPFKQAVKLPIIVSSHTYLRKLKGKIIINAPIKTGMILWGIGNVGIFDKKRSRSIIELTGTILFNGKARFGNGVKVSVSGELILGDNFTITAESTIFCTKKITFGRDCLLSWEDLIMDTDVHKIVKQNVRINDDKEINIGNKVWIGCRNTILKGTVIADNVVIAASSLVTGVYSDSNVIIAGNPARIVSKSIDWER